MSRTYQQRFITVALRDFLDRLIDGWMSEPIIKRNMHDLWTEWKRVLSAGILGVTESSPVERQAAEDNNYLYESCKLEDSLSISVYYPDGSVATLPPQHIVAGTLTSPSIEALGVMRWISIMNLRANTAYHNLLRVFRRLGKGSYGEVNGISMRRPEYDESIISLLDKMVVIPEQDLSDRDRNVYLPEAIEYVKNISSIATMKLSRDIVSVQHKLALAREYCLMREVSSILLPMGIQACVVGYNVHHCRGVSHKNYGAIERIGKNVCGSRVSTNLFMQYLRGVDLHSAQVSTKELNVIFAYLHGILSFLHNALGFNHNDLSPSNIFLWHYGYEQLFHLPLLYPDGSVERYLELPYRPVLIDLGMACTDKISQWSHLATPFNAQLGDIYNMYTRVLDLDVANVYEATVGFKYMAPLLDEYLTGWRRSVVITEHILDNMELRGRGLRSQSSTLDFMPNFGIDLPGLTHAEMVQAYIHSGTLQDYTILSPSRFFFDMNLQEEDKTDFERVRLQAIDVLRKYREKKSRNDTVAYIINYLREAITYYSH